MLGAIAVTVLMTSLVCAILSDVAGKEERYLRSRFGDRDDAYAARVPRILPRPSGFATPAQVSFDVATPRRNLADALVLLGLIPVGELMEYFKDAGAWPTIPIY